MKNTAISTDMLRIQEWAIKNPHSMLVDLIMNISKFEEQTFVDLNMLFTKCSDEEIQLAMSTINHVIKTKDTSPLEPTCHILKWMFDELDEEVTQAICNGEKSVKYNDGTIEVIDCIASKE